MSWSDFESAWLYDEAYSIEEDEAYQFEYEQWLDELEEKKESY